MIIRKGGVLKHYGTPRHSGRYPWGSGEDKFQRNPDFRANVLELKNKGMTEKEIADGFGMSIKDLRNKITVDRNQQDLELLYQARRLQQDGYGNTKIAEIMGRNESTIREWLDPVRQEKVKILENTLNMIKDQVNQKQYLDVGKGVELEIGVKRPLLDAAIYKLEQEGYKTSSIWIDQLGTGKKTEFKVLSKEDVDYQDLLRNKDKIRTITDWSEDGGTTYLRNEPVKVLDSSRVMVKFKEDGGADMDGMILLRRGVEDLSLGDKKYAQVRIAVENGKFMKGMAVYSDDIPDGVDIVYNSNKSKSVGKEGAFKTNESDDPTNPFGATIRQTKYLDKDGNEQLSPLNRVGYSQKIKAGEEGYWDTWALSKKLPSQFLSKQDTEVAREQLKLNVDIQKSKFDDIMKVTNPTVRQKLLDNFGDECDSKATNLEGAPLPGQSVKVLMSAPTLKPNECYMPSAKDGATYGLIRFPHAGQFEIPVLKVNNKNKQGQDMFGKDSLDVIAVHPKAAAQLSGADYDGDTVLAIPWTSKMQAKAPLKEIINFDTKIYKYPSEITNDPSFKDPKSKIHKATDRDHGMAIGSATNLITDMTNKGASIAEISRAARYSMVAVDYQKHDLDLKAAYRDFGIAELKKKYQGSERSGASTLLSRATAKELVPATRPLKKGEPGYEDAVRRADYSIDIATGRKIAVNVDAKAPYVNKDGKLVTPQPRKVSAAKMDRVEDAYELVSKNPSPKEIVYADYANEMKSLGNQARKESANTKPIPYSKSAKQTYSDEVESLDAKLKNALRNAPLERQAQNLGNAIVDAQRRSNPELTAAELKKIKGQALETARNRVGAGKQRIQITEKEWEAIQAGAISQNKLQEILNNTKIEDVQKLATPKTSTIIPQVKISRAKAMLSRGYSLQEISEQLGLPTSTIAGLK